MDRRPLPCITYPPPNNHHIVKCLVPTLIVLVRFPTTASYIHAMPCNRFAINDEETWGGRDVFRLFQGHPHKCFCLSGETPNTLLEMLANVYPLVSVNSHIQNGPLLPRNQLYLWRYYGSNVTPPIPS